MRRSFLVLGLSVLSSACGDSASSSSTASTSSSSAASSASSSTAAVTSSSAGGAAASSSTSAASTGGGGVGGGAGGAPPSVHMTGTVYSNEDGSAIPGAIVDVAAGAPTQQVTCDMNGAWAMDLPMGATVFLRASASGYYALVRGLVVPGPSTIRDYYLPATTTVDAWAASAGSPLDAAKGNVWVSFEDATVAGYSANVSAAHGASFTIDANYQGQASDKTLVGDIDHWFLIYPSIDPSTTTTITLSAPANHHCTPRETVVDWKLFAGDITYYDADCD